MNIDSRKSAFVKEYLLVEDEEILNMVEESFELAKAEVQHGRLEPMTQQELENRINQALDDLKNNRVYTNEEVKTKVEKWLT